MILGNGKMGKIISEIAKEKGHKIVCISNSKNPTKSINLSNADVEDQKLDWEILKNQ